MKNNGYTLVEVIAVILILALIILIAIPPIANSLKNAKRKAYNVQIEEIKSATKAWGLLNQSNLPNSEGESNSITITLLQLKLANLIASDFKNPQTGELFPDDLQISIVKKGMNFIYNVIEDSGTNNVQIDPNAPLLILNGSINQNVEINEIYSELGATAKDKSGNPLNVNITIHDQSQNLVYSISTISLNKYSVTYSATSSGLTSSINRIVNIVDTIPPNISVSNYTNNQYVDFEANSTYSLPIASVTDNSGVANYSIIGNFSPIIPGIKKVNYIATDNSGNKSEFCINFNVKDNISPVVTSASITSNINTGKKTITVIASDSGVGLDNYAYSYDNGITWSKENVYVFEGTYSSTIIVKDKVGNVTSIIPT